LSQQNKNLNKRVTIVILCAGEGIRLKDITKIIPKPLIKIEALNNKSILEDSINNLLKLDAENIIIIKGHLGNKIDEFIDSFKVTSEKVDKRLLIVDSGTQYKLGPLYSFLSIVRNDQVFEEEKIFVMIPGDTIFDYNLIEGVFDFLFNNFNLIQKYPCSFYRKIKTTDLKFLFDHKKISISEVKKIGSVKYLHGLRKENIQSFPDFDYIRQTIPIFLFSSNVIKEIIRYEKVASVNTVRQIINYMINIGKEVLAVKLDNKFDFFDIDYERDITLYGLFKKNKEAGQ